MAASRISSGTSIRTIFLVWLGWAVIMLGFQAFALARLDLVRPDTTLDWTSSWTNADASTRHPYLRVSVPPGHSAWDSEFYISIALHGYEDPGMKAAAPTSTADAEVAGYKHDHPKWVSLNHAFFPGYPFAMGLIARPLAATGMDPVGAATLAGVIVSLVSSLFAMLAIADLARTEDGEGEDEGDPLRAAFYLVIWPAAMFLAQVYSEALFLALSFGALAFLKRGAWGWAALLAVCAVFTRATGCLLVVPFAWVWWTGERNRSVWQLALVGAPALAYLAWRLVFGADFDFVETHYFGRYTFAIGQSIDAWSDAFDSLMHGAGRTRSYYLLEFAGTTIGLVTLFAAWRRHAALALYGLATFAVVLTSGAELGMHRYVLSLPTLFLAPAAWGRSPVFDRLWTLGCTLGLAVLAITFSFGFWAG